MLLTVTIFLPLLGTLALLFVPGERGRLIKGLAVAVSGTTLALAVALWIGYSGPGFGYHVRAEWIPAFGVGYEVGADGISLPLIAMTALLFFAALIYSFSIEEHVRAYFALMLLLETASLGLFGALDLFLFYVFFEVSLVGMYFVIAIWGVSERKEHAAIKFFLYTLLGSLPMLLGFIVLYLSSDPLTFSIPELARQQPLLGNALLGGLAFLGIFISFAIKTPLVPFHTWLPPAHVDAPTAGSIILAGVLLKMGTYGFVRILLTLLPDQFERYALPVAILGVISIIYGAFVAMAQRDFKSLIAYTSVNHMGYVILGVAVAAVAGEAFAARTIALNGAVLQMVAHGLVTGSLFLFAGVLQHHAGTREIDAFGGLAGRMPLYTAFTALAAFASLGLPGLAQFPAEFEVFLGTLQVYPVLAVISVFGVLITAALFLRALQSIFLGEENPKWEGLKDMDRREITSSAAMLVFVVVIGVYPTFVLSLINASTAPLLSEIGRILGGG